MSARRRPGGPVRQLSLQQSAATASRRPLRKQQSVDADRRLWSSINSSGDAGLRVTASSMGAGGHFPQESSTTSSPAGIGAVTRPRPVKVAWTDRRQQDSSNSNVVVVAKRCTGQPRPVSGKPQRPATGNLPSIGCEKDTILYTRQQLAERLRRAWREREENRPNLDIFLAHSNAVPTEEDDPRTSEASTDTDQSLLYVREDVSPGGDASFSISRNVHRDPNSEMNNQPAPQNISNFLPYSSAVGISKNLSFQKNNKALPLRINHPTKQTDISVVESLLSRKVNECPKQISQQTERRDKPVPTCSSSGHESPENSPYTYFRSHLNVGGSTAKINFNVFPKSDIRVSLKPSFPCFNLENGKMQSNSDSESSTSETTSSNKSIGTPHQIMETCPDVLNVTEDKILARTESAVITGTINFDESPRLSEITKECDRESDSEGRYSNSKIVVDVVPRKEETLSGDSMEPPPSDVSVEQSPHSCMENGQETLNNIEETKENNINVYSTKNFVSVRNKESCKVVQPSQTHAISTAQTISAAARRINFRNSVNKAITGSFSSDAPPTPAVSSVSRSTPTPPLSRALSAPPQKPGKGILVHRNRNNTSVDISSDVTDGDEEALVQTRGDRNIMSAPARRRLRTAGPHRKARSRGEESSGDEAEAGPRQKQKISAGRRGLSRGAEIVTMVSLVSDGSDAEGDATGPFLQPAPWLEERNCPAGQNQREQVICLKKSPKSVSFQQQPPVLLRATSALPITRRVITATSSGVPAGNTSGKAPSKAESEGVSRQKATCGHDTESEKLPTSPVKAEAECLSELPVQACLGAGPTEERATPCRNEASSSSPPDVTTERPSAGLGVIVAHILTPEPQPIPEPVPPEDAAEPEFQTPKERECWQLYRRMLEKGVSVSYDTVLRGMLTPTEYRLRRDALLSTC